MEGVLAAFAQFDNDVRSDRTRAGMRVALELGRWTVLAPRSAVSYGSKCRLANARPEPIFR
jgi:DNA invertase Pin-like site-specific DNA recombinase